MAEFFKWDPAVLSVRVAAMDAEHIELIKKMNALHVAYSEGKPKAVLAGLLDDLAKYTIKHFSDEEIYMESIKYEGIATHKIIHKQLLGEVTKHIDAFHKSGKLDDAFFRFLAGWLTSHIRGIDTKYSAARP